MCYENLWDELINIMKRSLLFLLLISTVVLALSSCYRESPKMYISLRNDSITHHDTLQKITSRHYCLNSNFIVKKDSLVLLRQQPEESVSKLKTDSLIVYKNDHLVVADIRNIPNDSIDSVWVYLARDQQTFGWMHEKDMLHGIVPDDPISQFISTFSNIHIILFLVILCIIIVGYTIRKSLRQNAYIVHFHDIDSFYPTLLTLLVSVAATLYASIQKFTPDDWQNFYFNPTLNPFSVKPLLSVFLISVWLMLLISLAVIDDLRHKLPLSDAVLYLCGLLCVCAADYIIFSISTLYYIGYVLYAIYVVFALTRYFKVSNVHYICGNCGKKLKHKGHCPYCGAMNI